MLGKKPDDAILTLQDAIKDAPDNSAGHLQLGFAYQLKGNLNQAEAEWRKAVQLQPRSSEGWRALANLASQRRDWSELESIGSQLTKIAPNAPEGYLFHSTARANQGDIAGAESDLNRLIQTAPQNAAGYIQFGLLRVQQKRWADADSLFKQALIHEPDSMQAKEALESDYQRGQPAAAVERLHEDFQKSPNNALAFLLGQRNPQFSASGCGAVFFARRRTCPSNANPLAASAQLQGQSWRVDAAIANHKRAIPLAPTNAQILVALGTLYESGRLAAGRNHLPTGAPFADNPAAANNLAYLPLSMTAT